MEFNIIDFYNGAECIYTKKEYGMVKEILPVFISDFDSINNKCKLKYKTGEYVLDNQGKEKIWKVDIAFQNKIIVPISYSERVYKLCPCCQKRYINIEDENICEQCKIELRDKKIKPLREFFEKHVCLDGNTFCLDDEQLECLCSNQNTLVTARAGSGKTRVLTAKLIDLMYNQGLSDDEVIAFCFNKNVAQEIKDRLNKKCTVDGVYEFATCDVVSTFHSFARKVVNPNGEILSDQDNNARKNLIRDIIEYFRKTNSLFNSQVIDYFLTYTRRIDRRDFKTDEAYYKFIRNSRYKTLKGDYVKSIAEKFIADFLFEYDIPYEYERHFYLNGVSIDDSKLDFDDKCMYKKFVSDKRETIPDFYLYTYNYVWEHWGVIGSETKEEQERFSNEVCDYQEYIEKRNFKKKFWNEWKDKLHVDGHKKNKFTEVRKLLETSCNEFNNLTREEIERAIKGMLESNGVKCVKLDDKTLIDKVWKNAITSFVQLMCQFIDKYQQKFFDNEKDFIDAAKSITDDKTLTFLRLGYMVYKEYISVLNGKNTNRIYMPYGKYSLDFNQCLDKAIKMIRNGEYDAEILRLKWILIDEYQDFSRLFYDLINAIMSRNNNIKLFCVGDDWQAINRFAGSDTKYFSGFLNNYNNAVQFHIHTNYRSEKHIVEYANKFMSRCNIVGERPIGLLDNKGNISVININDTRTDKLQFVSDSIFKDNRYFAGIGFETQFNIMRYIENIIRIIIANPNKKIVLLHRKGKFLGKDLDEIECIIKKLCNIDCDNFSTATVHSFKGKEADIIIIAEVDENVFPIFHPDNDLFKIFGEDMQDIIEDEEKLYYVALTRAKHSLYVLYDNPSYFVFTNYSVI